MTDEIMQQLWAAKDAIAEEADHDLDRLCQLLKQWQTKDKEKSHATHALQNSPEE